MLSLKKTIQTIHDQNERHYQEQQTHHSLPQPVLKVEAEIHEKPDPQRKKESQAKFNNGTQLALAIGTWLAFIAASGYGYVAIRQWREMISARHQAEQAVEAAIRSATYAQQSLQAADREFKADQRAWLGVPSENGLDDRGGLRLRNFGKTPAFNVRDQLEIIPSETGIADMASYIAKHPIPGWLNAGTVMPGDFVSLYDNSGRLRAMLSDVRVKQGKVIIYMVGRARYTTFNETHTFQWCGMWLPTAIAFDPGYGCTTWNRTE